MKFPSREHYDEFVKRVSQEISHQERERMCFYLYGSYTREDFVPGRSDLDGGFILDTDFVMPEREIKSLSLWLNLFLMQLEEEAKISPYPGIRLNFNLMDRAINRDGRFLAYDDTYTNYLKAHARITGPDFVQEMNGMNYKRESLRSAAYNLRKVRNNTLTYLFDLRKDPRKAKRSVMSSMSILWGMPKKLLECLGEKLEFENGSFFETFREIFPGYEDSVYREVDELRKNPEKYYGVSSSTKPPEILYSCLTATEEMIEAYVGKCPFPTRREISPLE